MSLQNSPHYHKEISILIADDSESILSYVENTLKEASDSYTVYTAYNGRVACKIAYAQQPDLILLDWSMPQMDGLQCLTALKKHPRTSNIPVIILTATDNLQVAFESGASDYIKKPFDGIELLTRIKSALTISIAFQEINKQKETLEEQKTALEQQIAITTQQRDLLILQKKEITDSIQYARYIQSAILPSSEHIKSFFSDSCIWHVPKDIVSGDFYWIEREGDYSIIGAFDCTGHGVPGAFLSILMYDALNRAVKEYNLTKPSAILNFASKNIIETLHNKDQTGYITDGMDASLCVIDMNNLLMEFSGAKNPIYIVRHGTLIELKVDSFAVGTHNDNIPMFFTTHRFQLQRGDVVYLFSDGITDQFGGKDNKKFKHRRFRELLTNIYYFPLEEQKKQIIQIVNDWKKDVEQLDDILFMGIRV